jgi:hypothetical protein
VDSQDNTVNAYYKQANNQKFLLSGMQVRVPGAGFTHFNLIMTTGSTPKIALQTPALQSSVPLKKKIPQKDSLVILTCKRAK